MAKPADIVQGVQEVYNLCSGRGKISWGSKDVTRVVIERKLHQLGLVQSFLLQSSHDSRLRKSQLALRGEVLCLDLSGQNIRFCSFLSSCLPESSFCELSQTMSRAKRKLKRLLCVLQTFFVAVSLDPGWDLAPFSLQVRLDEEWEWKEGKWGEGAQVAGPASSPHSCLLTCNQRWTSGQASPALIISGK